MHSETVRRLVCPLCFQGFTAFPTRLACASGHSFDLARQGYVNLVPNRPSVRIR